LFDANWLQALATALLGAVGLWVAQNLRRQVKVQLAQRQLDSYTALYEITKSAPHDRQVPLSRTERHDLNDRMNDWFYDGGRGIFLSPKARDLYVATKANLLSDPTKMKPDTLAYEMVGLSTEEAERRQGCQCLRHLSLLRAQLKTDITFHPGYRYYRRLDKYDRAFLRACGVSPWSSPWRRTLARYRQRKPFSCVCGLCDVPGKANGLASP
jgi:hypothetical protein